MVFLVILLIITGGGIYFLYSKHKSKPPSFRQQQPIHDSVLAVDSNTKKITDTTTKPRDKSKGATKKVNVNPKKTLAKNDSVIIINKITEPAEINHDSARRAGLQNDSSYQKFLRAVNKQRAELPVHRPTVRELLTPFFVITSSPGNNPDDYKKGRKKHRHKKQKLEVIDSTKIDHTIDSVVYADTFTRKEDNQLGQNLANKLDKNKSTIDTTNQEIVQYNVEQGESWQVVPVDTNWSKPIIVTKDFVNSFLTNDTVKVTLQWTFPNGRVKERKHLGRKKRLHRTFPFKTELRWKSTCRTYIIVKQESFEHRKQLH